MTEDSVQLSVDIANLTPGWSFPTTRVAKEPQNSESSNHLKIIDQTGCTMMYVFKM